MLIRVAAIQSSPVYNDLPASLEKTRDLIGSAANKGAKLVAFPETWLPGYPSWLDCCRDIGVWDHEPAKKLYSRIMQNSVTVSGPVTDAISEMAREHEIIIVIGAQESVDSGLGRGTLYNSLLTFGSNGAILACHRKVMPTFTERLIWGQGDGRSLQATDTGGFRLGGLICWEHWMPLTRQVMHESGEDIHVAAWPWVKEMNLVASRHYAFEGRCFVIACGALMRVGDLPAELEVVETISKDPDALLLRGGSAIIAPDGALVAGPVYDREEILVADLDLSRIREESMALDVTGHYSRPDIFDFKRKM